MSEGVFEIDCSEIDQFICLEDIKILNKLVTAPEKYSDELGLDEDALNLFQGIVDQSREMDEYSDGHENDDYGIQQIGTLTSLLETEFSYICREESDITYLAAVLIHRIAEGHPFEEGNKRTAFLSGSVFLIYWQLSVFNSESLVIPELDEKFLEALETIADDEEFSPESLANLYATNFKEKVLEVNSN